MVKSLAMSESEYHDYVVQPLKTSSGLRGMQSSPHPVSSAPEPAVSADFMTASSDSRVRLFLGSGEGEPEEVFRRLRPLGSHRGNDLRRLGRLSGLPLRLLLPEALRRSSLASASGLRLSR